MSIIDQFRWSNGISSDNRWNQVLSGDTRWWQIILKENKCCYWSKILFQGKKICSELEPLKHWKLDTIHTWTAHDLQFPKSMLDVIVELIARNHVDLKKSYIFIVFHATDINLQKKELLYFFKRMSAIHNLKYNTILE